jgi:hypothetical protein
LRLLVHFVSDKYAGTTAYYASNGGAKSSITAFSHIISQDGPQDRSRRSSNGSSFLFVVGVFGRFAAIQPGKDKSRKHYDR